MRRVSGLDAQFLYAETPSVPMHTLKISIMKPDPAESSMDRMRETFRANLHRLPPFHWQVLPTPLGMHHPMWIDKAEFNLDYHLRRVAVPAPGRDRELCEAISEIAAWPLDRKRPLWQIYMVEGLEGGRVAGVAKVHHAIADGVSSAELLLDYFTTEPVDGSLGPTELPADPLPSKLSLFWMGLRDQLRNMFVSLPQLLRAIRLARRRRRASAEHVPGRVPSMFSGPPTPWNRPITAQRSFAFLTLSLEDARSVATEFGVKVNDVFLSTAAGGMRAYLEEKGLLPDKALVGSMPASTRTHEMRRMWGNCLTSLSVPLRTDIADPVERLHATSEATRAVKHDLALSEGARPENWIELYPPIVLKLFTRLVSGLVKAGGPAVSNAIVSNVPGPKQQLYHNRASVENFLSVGPLLEGIGLNVTVWSYLGKLNYSFLACRELIPDLWRLVEFVESDFGRLLDAVARHRASSA